MFSKPCLQKRHALLENGTCSIGSVPLSGSIGKRTKTISVYTQTKSNNKKLKSILI